MSIERLDITNGPGPIQSRCVVHDGNIYLSGITADDFSGDFNTQLVDIFATIDDYLAKSGSDKSNILTAQVWLADMTLFAEMNAAWNAWVDPAASAGGNSNNRCR